MYEFVDTIESANNTSMSIETVFGGISLDDALTDDDGSFKTLTVSGRGILDRRIRVRERQGRDGDHEDDVTMEARVITVKYLLTDKTNAGFRDRKEMLNRLLLGSMEVLEFTDEDAYFNATLQGGDVPEEETNSIVGTLSFYCSDPTKKRNKQLTAINTTSSTHIIEGHTSTPYRATTKFTSSASSYTFEFAQTGITSLRDINKIVVNYDFIAGDSLEINYSKRSILLNKKDISNALSIINSNYKEIAVGSVEFKATNPTNVFYNERYY